MKKTICVILIAMLLILALTACSGPFEGMKKAYIKLPGGKAVTVEVKSWSYLDLRGNKMIIIDTDDNKYICSSFNVTMMNDDTNVVDPYAKDDVQQDSETENETP